MLTAFSLKAITLIHVETVEKLALTHEFSDNDSVLPELISESVAVSSTICLNEGQYIGLMLIQHDRPLPYWLHYTIPRVAIQFKEEFLWQK